MLVIRIAIIRIAAAGLGRSLRNIWDGILPLAQGRVKYYKSTYIHVWILWVLMGSGPGRENVQ